MTEIKIGYGRVSTSDQNPASQEDALKSAGCDRIYIDVMSGTIKNRPELTRALDSARSGDTLVVTRLDRLGRSTRNLLEIVASLQERGIQLEITEQGIDTNTIEGRLFFHIFAAVAEFEREIIKQRTMDGLSAARARGRVGGRPEKLTHKQKDQIITFYQAEQKTVQEIADLFNVSRPTIYRVLESTKVY